MQESNYISIPLNSFKKLRGLSGTACYVYGLFRAKFQYKKNVRPLTPVTDIFTFSFHEASQAGISENVFLKAIKHLVQAKLIRVHKRGKFGGRRPTLYQVY